MQLPDIHETGKECSVRSVKVSRIMAKASNKGKEGENITSDAHCLGIGMKLTVVSGVTK
jgi:hypothetical protein